MVQTGQSFDLIVLGSGGAGLTTAAVAASEGLRVLLLEKSDVLGGTTAFSGGAPWVPGNPLMDRAPGDDDRSSAEAYLREVLGNRFDEDRCTAYLDAAPKMLAYLQTKLGISFVRSALPDYSPELASARVSRTIASPEYDARNMKKDLLAKIRPQMPQFTLFGGMQVTTTDVPHLRNMFRSPKSFAYSIKIFLRYFADRLFHGRTTRLLNGRALVARLLEAATTQGVEIWTGAVTRELVVEEGAVTGVVVDHEGETLRIAARNGVVLATGGYGANSAMREQFNPLARAGWSVQAETCTGDGIQLGIAAGGHMLTDNLLNALGTPVSAHRDANGKLTVFPHFAYDRHLPGSIVVGPDGKRFVNEARDYQKFIAAMHTNGFDHVWLIADADFLKRYGMGLQRPFPYTVGQYVRDGYLIRSDTIGDLASRLAIEPAVLTATVARYNNSAREGRDPEFQRGEDAYSRVMGDATRAPSPTVGPIIQPPYYALELRPGELSTFAGLETDRDGRVLNGQGQIIVGLYAVGLDMNPVARGAYPSGGFGLGPGLSFGFRVALHAAGKPVG